jgi:hypothetical protein
LALLIKQFYCLSRRQNMSIPKRKALGMVVLFAVVLIGIGLAAWSEITLHPGQSGEAQWWYTEDPLVGKWVCGSAGAFCDPTDFAANRWGVELATYADGDWSYVSLNTGKRFLINDVQEASFLFRMVDPPGMQTDSGPSMAFSLVSPTGDEVIAISKGATPLQTNSCNTFDAANTEWWWGTWQETTQPTGSQWDPSTIDITKPDGVGGTGAFANMQSALAGYEVKTAMMLMGVVGETIGSNSGGPIYAGKAVVDDITLTWDSGNYGGLYRLEKPWPDTVDFDDWTQTPLPNGDPPRQYDQWCVGCDDCLEVDNQNLWGIVRESDLFGLDIPTVAKTFPSSEYAVYFGITSTGNYAAGESSVGAICSPLNELNPADEYVSVSFDYFREVEQYMGPYDWTYMQIQFLDAHNDPANGWDLTATTWYNPFDYTITSPDKRNPGDVHPSGPTGYDPPLEIDSSCSGTDVGWKTIWYKDSTDVNETDWQTAVVSHYLDSDENQLSDAKYRIKIPPKATRMRIRFVFNSVDGSNNDNFGWIIDNVVKQHSPSPVGCKIETDSLLQAEVGKKYGESHPDGTYFELLPQVIDGATTGARSWSIVSVTKDGRPSSLPRRLALDPRGRLYGELDPGTSGTYEITFQLVCFDGRPDTKTLVLNVRAPTGGTSQLGSEDFDDPGDDGLSTSGTNTVEGAQLPTVAGPCPNLWHQTGNVKYALDTTALKDDYHHVAYFGQYDDGKPTVQYDPNYACSRAKGCMITRQFPVLAEHDGQELIVGFKSWRNVEYFTDGEYDRTWVDIHFEGGNWQTIWSKSSKDQSLAAWTWQEVHTGLELKQGVKIQVRFCFDSIDSYNNGKAGEAYGWLVDEISLYAGSAELSISNCPAGNTSVGEYYKEGIRASGGTIANPRFEIASGELPPGLGLIQPDASGDRRLAHIEGIARTAGTYMFTIRARDDGWTEVATRQCTIVVTEDVTLLYEDFEDDPSWSLGGLWHFTTDGGVIGVDNTGPTNHAAYYGQNDTTNPNYKTGSRTTGMLTLVTPEIDLASGPGETQVDAVKIEFEYWREVESFGNGNYDKTLLQVKLDDGDWTTVWSLDSSVGSASDWITTDVPAFLTNGASTMYIRFVFDSIDKWYNNYTGFLVDNIKVHNTDSTGVSQLSAMAVSQIHENARNLAEDLEVMNIPNPVRDVHTTTFMVRSVAVEAMKIQIFDLSGALVFEEETPGNELEYHTVNDYGEYLANGIYLYRAFVLIGGEWIQTDLQKLVILR